MTHRLGRVVPDGGTITQSSGIDLTPIAGPYGPVRFVILHFDDVPWIDVPTPLYRERVTHELVSDRT